MVHWVRVMLPISGTLGPSWQKEQTTYTHYTLILTHLPWHTHMHMHAHTQSIKMITTAYAFLVFPFKSTGNEPGYSGYLLQLLFSSTQSELSDLQHFPLAHSRGHYIYSSLRSLSALGLAHTHFTQRKQPKPWRRVRLPDLDFKPCINKSVT